MDPFLYKNTWMWCSWQHIGLPNRRCRIITGYPLSEGESRHFLTSVQTIKYSRRPQARSSAPWAGSRNGVTLVLHTRDGGFDSCPRDYHILSTTSRLTISVQGNIIYSCGLCAVTLIRRWCENQMGSTYRASP